MNSAPIGLLPLSMYRVTGRRKVPVTPTNETRYRCFRDALRDLVDNGYGMEAVRRIKAALAKAGNP